MRVWFVLFRRELAAFYMSLVGYIVLVLFLLGMGIGFVDVLMRVQGANETPVTLFQLFVAGIWFWIVMLIVPPVLTMRLFAEERSSGTIEPLMTAPVTEWQVVLAKFFGALAFYVTLWVPTLGFVGLMRFFSSASSSPLDVGQMCAGYLGVLLVGSLFLAIGSLASALTRNQIIAALMTFVGVLLFFVVGVFVFQAREAGNPLQHVLGYISALEHMIEFGRGRVDVRRLVFYVSATGFVLWATKLVLEARKWR